MPQSLTQRLLKRHQLSNAFTAQQHERPMVTSAMKAHHLIERDIKGRCRKLLGGQARPRNKILSRRLNKITQVMQRDVQALRA